MRSTAVRTPTRTRRKTAFVSSVLLGFYRAHSVQGSERAAPGGSSRPRGHYFSPERLCSGAKGNVPPMHGTFKGVERGVVFPEAVVCGGDSAVPCGVLGPGAAVQDSHVSEADPSPAGCAPSARRRSSCGGLFRRSSEADAESRAVRSASRQ